MSKFLTINWRDFLKGLVVAVLTAILSTLYNILSVGGAVTFRSVLVPGVLAMIAYLLKNLVTNKDDQLLTPDK